MLEVSQGIYIMEEEYRMSIILEVFLLQRALQEASFGRFDMAR